MEIGRKDLRISLAAARVNAGLTQKEAAKVLGISQKTLFNYEKGDNIPNWEMVKRISNIYGIPDEIIFFGKRND